MRVQNVESLGGFLKKKGLKQNFLNICGWRVDFWKNKGLFCKIAKADRDRRKSDLQPSAADRTPRESRGPWPTCWRRSAGSGGSSAPCLLVLWCAKNWAKGHRREREVAKLITVFWGSGMFSSGPQCEEVVAALRSGREGASARRKMPRKRWNGKGAHREASGASLSGRDAACMAELGKRWLGHVCERGKVGVGARVWHGCEKKRSMDCSQAAFDIRFRGRGATLLELNSSFAY